MVTFFSMGVDARLGKENKLLHLNRLLNWKRISNLLAKVHQKDEQEVPHGGFSYDKLKMFKAVLLGQWHSLSDPGLEEALRVRLDFMSFTGFELNQDIPDDTTLCRFRNKLIAKKLDQTLFKEINKQLETLGLKLEKAEAAVVDATIIESGARPNRTLEISDDRNEDLSEEDADSDCMDEVKYEISESADKDARWLKKGKKSYYGYKAFVVTDNEGYINVTHVTPGNKSEMKELEHILPAVKGKRLYGDKGFASKENRLRTRSCKIKSGIMYKAQKHLALTYWQKKFNKMVSKVRYVVEQSFGTLKRRFMCSRSSYMSLEKVRGQFTLKSICYNLLKGLNKIKFA